MSFEQYTLILRHDWVQGEDRMQVEPPLIMRYSVDRVMAPGPAVILNSMMDEFKREVLKRIEREGRT